MFISRKRKQIGQVLLFNGSVTRKTAPFPFSLHAENRGVRVKSNDGLGSNKADSQPSDSKRLKSKITLFPQSDFLCRQKELYKKLDM